MSDVWSGKDSTYEPRKKSIGTRSLYTVRSGEIDCSARMKAADTGTLKTSAGKQKATSTTKEAARKKDARKEAHRETLYSWCASRKRAYLEVMPWSHFAVSLQEIRDSFQYIRKNNYEVFDMFYGMPNVILQGGKLVNEWERNS